MTAPLAFTTPLSFLAAAVLGERGLPAKEGVSWRDASGHGVQLVLLAGLYRAQWAVEAGGFGPFVITSIYDGTHLPTSFHYKGRAADLRTRHLTPEMAEKMWHLLADVLGPGWDVILESDHIHIEWDPRAANAGAAFKGTRE